MRKKVNPRRTPVSAAVAEARARKEATVKAWAIMFTVLRDKEGYDVDGLKRVLDEVENISDSIVKGYIRVDDLIKALQDEAGIILK